MKIAVIAAGGRSGQAFLEAAAIAYAPEYIIRATLDHTPNSPSQHATLPVVKPTS